MTISAKRCPPTYANIHILHSADKGTLLLKRWALIAKNSENSKKNDPEICDFLPTRKCGRDWVV